MIEFLGDHPNRCLCVHILECAEVQHINRRLFICWQKLPLGVCYYLVPNEIHKGNYRTYCKVFIKYVLDDEGSAASE